MVCRMQLYWKISLNVKHQTVHVNTIIVSIYCVN